MSDFVIGEQIEKHKDALEAMGKALMDNDDEAFISEAAGLIVTIASDLPLLGPLVKHGFARIFSQSANAVLKQQIAEWDHEQDRRQFIDRLAGRIEVLLGQALVQIIRAQHNVKGEIIEALGGIRQDLAAFRKDFARRAYEANAELRVEQEVVSGGATGVRIRTESRKSVFIRQGEVTGPSTTGVKVG